MVHLTNWSLNWDCRLCRSHCYRKQPNNNYRSSVFSMFSGGQCDTGCTGRGRRASLRRWHMFACVSRCVWFVNRGQGVCTVRTVHWVSGSKIGGGTPVGSDPCDAVKTQWFILVQSKSWSINNPHIILFAPCPHRCNSFIGNGVVQKKPQSKSKKSHLSGHKGGSSSREPQPKRLEEVYTALKQGLEWVTPPWTHSRHKQNSSCYDGENRWSPAVLINRV